VLDAIPEQLKEGEGWELLNIDPNWIFVVHYRQEIVGVLLACNCHGLAMIWRIKMLKTAPAHCLLFLLRDFVRIIKKRGCMGFMAFCELDKPNEQALIRIAKRAGCNLIGMNVMCVTSSVEVKHCPSPCH